MKISDEYDTVGLNSWFAITYDKKSDLTRCRSIHEEPRFYVRSSNTLSLVRNRSRLAPSTRWCNDSAKSWVGQHCYAVWSFRRPMSPRSIQLNVRRSWRGTQGWKKGKKIGFGMTLIAKIAWNTRWDESLYAPELKHKAERFFLRNFKKFETIRIAEAQTTFVAM